MLALEIFFKNGKIQDYPVYLLSVIGETRKGKSFLMNYIMRALQSQENGEQFSLETEDGTLHGFEWKAGTVSTTKGIWIWSKPFILEHKGDKMAVFVMDTEGSLDIESNKHGNMKLCTMTMLLSSHLIYNVSCSIKETELDFLEIYVDDIGVDAHKSKAFTQYLLKHLDILIRDWPDSEKCTREDADSYMNELRKKFKKKRFDSKALKFLERASTKCFLMPNPGKKITRESNRRITDMDQDFEECLKMYLSDVVKRTLGNIRTSRNGLTCAQFAERLQGLVSALQNIKNNIASPLEMMSVLKCKEEKEKIRKEFNDFLERQSSFVMPHTMRQRISEKSLELLEQFVDSLQDSNCIRLEDEVEELNGYLQKEVEKFCNKHKWQLLRYTATAVSTAVPLVGGIWSSAAGAMAAKEAVAVASGTGILTASGKFLQSTVSLVAGSVLRRWL
ncbi:RING finger protein 112-like [Rhinophrynus dorsalis]